MITGISVIYVEKELDKEFKQVEIKLVLNDRNRQVIGGFFVV